MSGSLYVRCVACSGDSPAGAAIDGCHDVTAIGEGESCRNRCRNKRHNCSIRHQPEVELTRSCLVAQTSSRRRASLWGWSTVMMAYGSHLDESCGLGMRPAEDRMSATTNIRIWNSLQLRRGQILCVRSQAPANASTLKACRAVGNARNIVERPRVELLPLVCLVGRRHHFRVGWGHSEVDSGSPACLCCDVTIVAWPSPSLLVARCARPRRMPQSPRHTILVSL